MYSDLLTKIIQLFEDETIISSSLFGAVLLGLPGTLIGGSLVLFEDNYTTKLLIILNSGEHHCRKFIEKLAIKLEKNYIINEIILINQYLEKNPDILIQKTLELLLN